MINFNYLCGRKQKKSGIQKLKIFIKYDFVISVTNYKCVNYTLFTLGLFVLSPSLPSVAFLFTLQR